MSINKEGVLNALKSVIDPDLRRDIVSLNFIKNLEINGNKVKFDIELTTPACPVKDQMKQQSYDAVKKQFPEAEEINITLTAQVRTNAGKKNEILPGVKNMIAVASGKGGVGKSTVAVNLAVALAKEGANVGLIDADIYGPSIPLMLGIEDKPKIYQDNLTGKMLPLKNYGIKLMSIGFFIDNNDAVVWRGPMASGALKQFMTDIYWGEIDYLIFDMPPGTGDVQLTLTQTVPLTGAVIVSTPQPVALIDARKGLKMFEKVNVPILGIIENMSYFIAPDTGNRYDIFGTGGAEALAEEMNVKLLGKIPIDPRIREGGDNGNPIVYDMPDSENSKIIQQISRELAAQVSIVNIESSSNKVEISLD